MSEATIRDKFRELNLSQDEMSRLSEALKKEEFRKLLLDYAEEISDPKNRELYEQEISALEQERGMNVTFIHPEPGYCLKTTQESREDGSIKKCFVNICRNDQIEKPTCKRESKGASWSIPHSCSPPREDFDSTKSAKQKCMVYDIVFSSDAYRMGETNERFNRLLVDSAFESIENNFGVKLDKVNYKRLKNMQFKGKPTACVLRKRLNEDGEIKKEGKEVNHEEVFHENGKDQDDVVGSIIDQLKQQYLINENPSTTRTPSKSIPSKPKMTNKSSSNPNPTTTTTTTTIKEESSSFTEPSYKLVHRGQVDMQDYAQHISNGKQVHAVESTRPKELVITVELPLCKSSDNVVLDIFEKRLHLKSVTPNYLLDLSLPYPINESGARAKFDKSRRCLNVTLPVVPFVAKVDIVNVDHLSDDEDVHSRNRESKSLSPSPSSSSSSSLSESNLDSIIATQLTPNKPTIKYTLPANFKLNEYKNSISIEFKIPNFDRKSIALVFLTQSDLKMTCESTSKSGYTQYFLAHMKFCISSDQSAYNFVAPSLVNFEYFTKKEQLNDKFSIHFVDDETFQIVVNKTNSDKGGKKEVKKVLISAEAILTASAEIDLNNNDSCLCVELSQEFVNKEFIGPSLLDFSNADKESITKLSRRDFILNFDKIAMNNNEIDQDDQKQEEDEDEDEDNEIESSGVRSKLGERVAAKGGSEFMSKNLPDKIDEEEEEKSGNNLEEDFLNGKDRENSDSEQSENEDEENLEKSAENIDSSLSLSSSVSTFNTDSSNLTSSLNSYSFTKLKSILKKPRSVSESEGGCCNGDNTTLSQSAPGTNNVSHPKNRHSFSGVCSKTNKCEHMSDCHNTNCHENSCISKKCVSFNKQVVRNIFKPGSTIVGMKKPGSNKNKKKNKQRKRTISDPCHENTNGSESENGGNGGNKGPLRSRSVSDSCEDTNFTMDKMVAKQTTVQQETCSTKKSSKKKKKNNGGGGGGGDVNSSSNCSKDDCKNNENSVQGSGGKNTTNKCAIQFTNKIVNSLDN